MSPRQGEMGREIRVMCETPLISVPATRMQQICANPVRSLDVGCAPRKLPLHLKLEFLLKHSIRAATKTSNPDGTFSTL